MTKAYKSQKPHQGRKQSRDIFIRQESIPAFELEKKGKMKAASNFSQAKKNKSKTSKTAIRKKK